MSHVSTMTVDIKSLILKRVADLEAKGASLRQAIKSSTEELSLVDATLAGLKPAAEFVGKANPEVVAMLNAGSPPPKPPIVLPLHRPVTRRKKGENATAIARYIAGRGDGAVVTTKDIMDGTGLVNASVQYVLTNNRDLFEIAKTEGLRNFWRLRPSLNGTPPQDTSRRGGLSG